MYNQGNLPLSKVKIFKKTLYSLPRILLFMMSLSAILIPFILEKYSLSLLIYVDIIVFILFTLIKLFYEFLYYKNYSYEFREDSAQITKGVVSRSTGHVKYEKLQNVYVDQDVLDRIFGLYDVHYETAGEKSAFYSHVDGLNKERADKLIEFLTSRNNSNSTQRPIEKKFAEDIKENTTKENQKIISNKEYPILQSYVWISSLKISFWLSIFSAVFLILGCRANDTFEAAILITSFLMYWIIFFVLIFIISYIYMSIWYKNFSYKLDSEKGEIRSKVIGESVSYFNYDRLQNINVTQGIIEMFFGIYHVLIETAGEASSQRLTIPALNKENSEKLKNFLLDKTNKYKAKL